MPYSVAHKAYLAFGGEDLHPTLEISWPDGEVGRYSTLDLVVPGVGNFESRIESIREPTEGVTARFAGISVLESTVTLIDGKDPTAADFRAIMRKLKGPLRCRRVPAVVKMASPDVPYADWPIVIQGIFDRPRFHSGNRVDLVIRTDDRWLDSPVFRIAVLSSEWEDLPEENRGVWMPIIFGIHDSRGLSDKGMIPTINVALRSTTLRWDLVCHAWVQTAPRVYVGSGDSFTLAPAAHYFMQRLFRNDDILTLIVWDPSFCPAADQEVRVDCSGLTLDGTIPTQAEIDANPAANLAYNPVAQLRLWLRLYVRNSWTGSNPFAYPDEVGIDAASWDEAEEYAERYGLQGAFRLGGTKEQRTALEIITEWLGNWTMFRIYWTAAGQLAIGAIDCRWPGYGTGSYFDLIRDEDKHVLTPLDSEADAEGLINRVTAAHLFDEAQGKSWDTLEVQDVSRDENKTHDMRMTMGPSSREN